MTMEAIGPILIISFLFYISYRIIRFAGKNFINGELKKDSSKFSIKIKDWFVWNVKVNNEKGTAGGNN